MNKNEYLCNTYKVIINNKFLHLIFALLEYFFSLSIQISNFATQFQNGKKINISWLLFHLAIEKLVNIMQIQIKLIIIPIIYILIIIYFFIYSKFSFKNINLFNKIIINVFEIFIFRAFFIIIFYIAFSINNNIALFIFIVLSIPLILLIINHFLTNHLYYFSPHFKIYPYDFYSSYLDIFHLIEKVLICISSQSFIKALNEFLFIITFLLEIISFLVSVYIFYFKSYYIMKNTFINKSKFSFLLSTMLISFIMIIMDKNDLKGYSFLIIIINIYVIFFILIQIFYDPYQFAFFSNNENIENLYFYFHIIDNLKNDSFILEEKLEKHYSSCRNCELCYKLQKYLMNKVNYKKLYKILYKDYSILSNLINELIHVSLTEGKESIRNNSYFLINIIYCYYINYKNNYVLSSNLKLLYEIINEDNKNILDNHLLSSNQVLLINEFLNKSDKILNQIKDTILEKIMQVKVEKFFVLFESIFDLKNKKFQKLYYNKNEGIINFFRYISICSMIYEEIFNTSFSNSGVSLKENQIFLDDLSSKNNSEINQIIIQLNLLNFENKIIYILGEFSKFKNKTLCQLFPQIFRSKQLLIIKNKITNSKYFKSWSNEESQNNTFGNNNKDTEGDYIDFQFIIYENEKKKKYKLINLRLSLIYPLDMTKYILLYGFYSFENNIIITLDKSSKDKKKEYLLNNEDKENLDENNILIKYKKNEKYYNNQKLIFINKYFINLNCYNIYYILNPVRQKTYKEDINYNDRNSNKNVIKEINSKMKNELYGESEGNQNFNNLFQNSSSTFTSISNNKHNFKKRSKNGNKDKKKKNIFRYFQFNLVFLCILLALCQIICHISIEAYIKFSEKQSAALTNFKNYIGIYNSMISNLLPLVCLSKESRGDDCSSIIELYENFYNNSEVEERLDLKTFFLLQNQFASNEAIKVKQKINEAITNSEDKDLLDFVNSKMPTFYLNQNISKNEIKLSIVIEQKSFLEFLDLMNNGLLIISSKYDYLKEKVYIVNDINLNNFFRTQFSALNHVKLDEPLSQYQIYFYYFILNYQFFCQRMDLTCLKIIIKASTIDNKCTNLIFFSVALNLILYLLMHFVLFLYMRKYYKIVIDLFEEIHKKMNIKNESISINEMFLQKIEKLKTIVSLYKQDIYQAIVDLNFIYDNYKKFIEQKNKEMEKYLKKEKILNNTNRNKKNIKNIKMVYIINAKENKIYKYNFILTLIYSIALNISFYLMWLSYYGILSKINEVIKVHSNFSNDAYKFLNYYQLMIYHNYSMEDINSFERFNQSLGQDLFSKIYSDIQALYDVKKLIVQLSRYDLGNVDPYFNYTCKTYYEYLFASHKFLKSIDIKYKNFFLFSCKDLNIYESTNYKQIFTILFEHIQIGINEINDRSYRGLINTFYNEKIPKAIILFLTFYNYAFELLGMEIQRKSSQQIDSIRIKYININFFIYYATSFSFLLIIIFVYIWKINIQYKKIHGLKKVFKICKKKE